MPDEHGPDDHGPENRSPDHGEGSVALQSDQTTGKTDKYDEHSFEHPDLAALVGLGDRRIDH